MTRKDRIYNNEQDSTSPKNPNHDNEVKHIDHTNNTQALADILRA